MTWQGYSPRSYRVVRLVSGEAQSWVVVSYSMRDDETWDVIWQAPTRRDAFDYVEEVSARNRRLARDGTSRGA